MEAGWAVGTAGSARRTRRCTAQHAASAAAPLPPPPPAPTARGEYVARVYEAIQDLCRLLHHLLRLLRQHLVLQALAVQDQVQRIVVVGHLGR